VALTYPQERQDTRKPCPSLPAVTAYKSAAPGHNCVPLHAEQLAITPCLSLVTGILLRSPPCATHTHSMYPQTCPAVYP
jgi:hypothetical protein